MAFVEGEVERMFFFKEHIEIYIGSSIVFKKLPHHKL